MKRILVILLLSLSATFAQTYVQSEITTNETWTAAGNPYILGTQYVNVHNDTNPITLTIEAGVIVQGEYYSLGWPNFDYSRLVIGENASLVIYGTEGSPVRFTKRPGGLDDKGWGGIIFEDNSNATQSLLSNVIINDGGGEVDGIISVYVGSPTFQNIQFNTTGGQYDATCLVIENSDAPIVDNCKFQNCRHGIYVENSDAIIKNSYFNADWNAIELNESFPTMYNNLFADNQSVRLNDLSISGTLSIPGYLENGEVAPFSIGPQHIKFENASENVKLTIEPGVVIKGEAYTTAWPAESASRIEVGINASLELAGEIDNPIIFDSDSYHGWGGIVFHHTADFDETVIEYVKFLNGGWDLDGAMEVYGGTIEINKCDFYGVNGFYADSSANVTLNNCNIGHSHGKALTITNGVDLLLENVTVDSCRKSIEVHESNLTMNNSSVMHSYEIGNGLYLDGGNVTIDNSIFKDNSSRGIYAPEDKTIDVNITNSIFSGNNIGIDAFLTNGSEFVVNNSDISGNNDRGIRNSSNIVIDAQDNWWGDVTGPYDNSDDANDPTGLYNPNGLGDHVDDYVDYGGWLTFWETESPNILCMEDVPNDQGRWMHICWSGSSLDKSNSTNPILKYSVWRKVDENVCPSGNTKAPSWMNKKYFDSITSEGWDFIHDVTAVPEFERYYYVAPTLGDSNASAIIYSTFMIIAHTDNPGVYFKSNEATGYSIDNLSPAAPGGLAATVASSGQSVRLEWTPSDDLDFDYFKIYKNDVVYAETADTFFVDNSVLDGNYDYKITALDFNGNESDFSEKVYVIVGIEEENALPKEFAMLQNYPNPFNPSTTISFALPRQTNVKLNVYNSLGEEVAELINANKEAGNYTLNFNASHLSSGLYFYRITAGNFVDVKKMLLIK